MSEKYLNLQSVQSIARDEHFACWLSQIWPVFDRGVYQHLMIKNNWLKNILPNAFLVEPIAKRQVPAGQSLPAEILAAGFDFWPEKLCRFLQMKIMPAELKSLINQNNDVVVNDCWLKFHSQDKRLYYHKKLVQKFSQLL